MKTTLFALMLAGVPAAWATNITYSFNSPTGNLGTSETYIASGVSITAYGFDNGHATDLYAHHNGGLGLVSDGDQIGDGFITLDLKNFWALDPTGVTITIADVQRNESWEIFGSNTLGSLGTKIQTGSTNAPVASDLALSADNYRYINITAANCSDVLLSGLFGDPSSPTPEPGSFAMIGIGVILLSVSRLKRNSGSKTRHPASEIPEA